MIRSISTPNLNERPTMDLTIMNTDDNEHKFNSDLLASDRDRRIVHELYSTLEHVLYHEELIRYFARFNDRADIAKKMSRQWGKWAIVLAAAAIALAAVEIVADATSAEAWALLIGGLAAMFGLASVAIGAFGLLFGSRKREWLRNRFMGERIRQFHFQSLIGLLPQIFDSMSCAADKSEEMKKRFESDRHKIFLQFRNEFEGNLDSKFVSAIEPHGDADCWLHESQHRFPVSDLGRVLDPFFSAYRQLRIKHQLDYANYKLGADHKLFSAMPTRQAQVLENLSKAGIAWLFLIHATALAIVIFALGSSIAEHQIFRPIAHGPNWISIVFSLAIIVIAVVALSARAFQQGLQPEREIERYQQYRSAVESILEQFDEADTPNGKVRVMRQMERLSFDELRNFMRTNNRSSFAM
jgi:hypothetical protein